MGKTHQTLFRSGVTNATEVCLWQCYGACVRRQFRLAGYEFVWGVNVLTNGMRNSFAVHRHIGGRPGVTHLFQDKELKSSGEFARGVSPPDRNLEGSEYI